MTKTTTVTQRNLRRRPAVDTTKQNDSTSIKHPVKKTKFVVKKTEDKVSGAILKSVTRNSNGIFKNSLIKGSPTKKLTVLSTKLRGQRIKQLTDAGTPKTKQLDQSTRSTRNNKNPSEPAVKKRGRPAKTMTQKIKHMQLDQKSPIITKNDKKTSEIAFNTKEVNSANKTPTKVTLQVPKTPIVVIERLSKRLEKIYNGKNKDKFADSNMKEVNFTPQNKDVSIRNKSGKPTRVLRKRNNLIPNKYKDCTLNSPLFTKSQKPSTPNPLAVYEFEFDPSDEPAKKHESESSGDEDSDMKYLLKKLRKTNKRVAVTNNKRVNKKQKKVPNNKTKQDHGVEKQVKPTIIAEKQKKSTVVAGKQFPAPEKQKKPTTVVEKHLPAPEKQKQPTTVAEKQLPALEKQKKQTTVTEKQLPASEKQLPVPEIIDDLPQMFLNSVEMVSISDHSDPLDPLDPIDPVDPSIQARCIVDEVTKSFIEDLSDEESNSCSPGKIKIHSNVVVRQPKTYKNKNKIFNSTTIGLKPSRPWRIDVSAIRNTPHIFTYKDKSFTPRYEPEVVVANVNIVQSKTKCSEKNQENTKPTFQTSILDFVKGSKPKIIENKTDGLFNDLPQKPIQSPRKVLGEINFVQSTPLKPINNNILKSPNISFIKPKNKSSGDMFGFSYNSDEDENKENVRKSPRKSPKKIQAKTANPVVHIVKKIVPIIDTNEKLDKDVKKENLTATEPDISAVPDDSDFSFNLFEDVEKEIEVLKKSTRKYVRKFPKRKRLPSVDTLPSEDESEHEEQKKKKPKKKNVRTEEEEKEANRLAAHYNSIFEEMSKYPLIIE